jgi:uncharacterized protein
MNIKLLTVILLLSSAFFTQALFAQDRVVDNAGVLSDGEIAELTELVETIAANYNFDLVIVTEKDIGGASPMDYADDFFDKNGYGLGEDRDGCLLLEVTESREYWFSTSGRGIKILNSTAFKELESTVVPYLKINTAAGARAFISEWYTFLALDAKGRNYNFFYKNNTILVIIAWVLSLVIGLMVVQSWKRQMNTALAKDQADSFILPGSLAFSRQTDRFLYSTVTKTLKPKAPSSVGSHTSSSGRRHGGGGGRH